MLIPAIRPTARGKSGEIGELAAKLANARFGSEHPRLARAR